MSSIRSKLARLMVRYVVRPKIAGDLPLERSRPEFEKLSRLRFLPRGTRIEPLEANDGVAGEWVDASGAKTERVMLYLHGGCFVQGSPFTHRELVARISRAAGARVLSLDYSLAPERPFPAGVEDCLRAYRFLLKSGFRPDRIVIAGDSAGGGLAMATLLRLRDAGEALPAACILLSPWVDLEMKGGSIETNGPSDPMLGADFLRKTAADYIASGDARDPGISPLFADLKGLPPLLIHVARGEVLQDDGEELARKARAAGVEVELLVRTGMWHVWHFFAALVPEAREDIARLGEFVRKHGGVGVAV